MAGPTQQLNESVVIRSFRRFRDRYFTNSGPVVKDDLTDAAAEPQPGLLDSLPVDIQFLIMTFLYPADICSLGAASRYWRAVVRDPLLWRYFLLRDMLNWPSIDHVSMPQLELLDAPLINEDESLDDREEWDDKGMESKVDYMSEWVSFSVGLRQGIGSGISYMLRNQHKFNILTLYSNMMAEREKAKVQEHSISNKLFTFEGTDDSGSPIYRPAPQVQQVCRVVDGFIYVANAEPGRGDGESEAAHIRAVLSSAEDSATKPLLVLSCVSREESEEVRITRLQIASSRNMGRRRTPCVDMAKRLGLPQLANPWMVQDTAAESLSGLIDGVSWLLRCSRVKLYGS
ncbi:F-box only protein 4 isoform X2 [Pungitius pungitius]|uniref:F-box only protein 4 isoform X2 n=1 Tax=Pungitius pungitius TaxID=134920 RepID=UPI002E12FC74